MSIYVQTWTPTDSGYDDMLEVFWIYLEEWYSC